MHGNIWKKLQREKYIEKYTQKVKQGYINEWT